MAILTGTALVQSILDATGVTLTNVERIIIEAKIQYQVDNNEASSISTTLTIMAFSDNAKIKAQESGDIQTFVADMNTTVIESLDTFELPDIPTETTPEEIAYDSDKEETIDVVEDEVETVPSDVVETIDPTTFSVTNSSLGELSTSATTGVSSLASQSYWDLTQDRTITYSFNTSLPSDYNSYGSELTNNWAELNSEQKSTIRTIFDKVDDILNITFEEVLDTSAQSDGDIQLNMVDMDANTAGFAFYPDTAANYDGDMFLSNGYNTTPADYGLSVGDNGWFTMVHELGHALGLEHPFDTDNTTKLDTQLDDVNHTVMSYTNANMFPTFDYTEDNRSWNISFVGKYLNPQLYSLYDLSALESIYGANTTTNIDNNTYTYSYSDNIISTIWDAGGVDTIDLSSTVGKSTIDLRGGSLNSADQYTKDQIIAMHQALVDPDGNNADSYIEERIDDIDANYGLYTGENNLAIAVGVVIENINSGSGDDTITDNEVDNIINTAGGDDSIFVGNGGYDSVDGGAGIDTLYIDLARDAVSVESVESGGYLMYSDSYAVAFENIEFISFSGDASFAVDVLIA